MTTSTRPSLRPAILGFVLSLTVMVVLLTAQFVLKYRADIFGNGIPASAIFQMLVLGALGTVELALPISVLVMTAVYYRSVARQGHSIIRIRPTLLAAAAFAIACFIWTAFLMPVIQLHEVRLLFDIRGKEVNVPMEETNLSLFKGSVMTSNYFKLNTIADSIHQNAADKKAEFLEYASRNQMTKESLVSYQEVVNQQIDYSNDQLNRFKLKKAQMISFPLLIFVLFYAGMFLGYLNRDNRLWILLAGIYVILLPGIYFLSIYFEKLAKSRSISPFQSQLFYISIVFLLTVGLFWYTKQYVSEFRSND